MSAHNTDGLQALVRGLAEAMYNEPGDKPLPLATTDADEAIKSQLTENTGTHFLDSGSAYGRHWEENQDTPPWERPEWDVSRDFVTHNVYHFMDRQFKRDSNAVALEAGLYAYGHNGPGEGDSWLTCMEDWADTITNGPVIDTELREMGVPEEFIEDILGVQHDLLHDGNRLHGRDPGNVPTFTANTYNHECHGLSQVLQGANFGGPYAEYVMVQVHQGADVRGGYTGPRVYKTRDGWFPHELHYHCETCDWTEAESVLYGDESLLYVRDVADVPEKLIEAGWHSDRDDIEEHPAVQAAYEANEDGYHDGAVFHRCREEPGHFGHVSFA